jgi:hypothetical protein
MFYANTCMGCLHHISRVRCKSQQHSRLRRFSSRKLHTDHSAPNVFPPFAAQGCQNLRHERSFLLVWCRLKAHGCPLNRVHKGLNNGAWLLMEQNAKSHRREALQGQSSKRLRGSTAGNRDGQADTMTFRHVCFDQFHSAYLDAGEPIDAESRQSFLEVLIDRLIDGQTDQAFVDAIASSQLFGGFNRAGLRDHQHEWQVEKRHTGNAGWRPVSKKRNGQVQFIASDPAL